MGHRQRQVHLFVLIDALGWQFVEGRDFLSELLPYRRPLRTVLGFSSGAIPTILTGVPPAQSGHWNLFYYDPVTSPFRWLRHLNFLSDRVMDHRVTKKILKELGRHFLGMGPLFECCVTPRLLPWFNWVEKRNIYECGGISGKPSIFDELDERDIPFRVYSYHSATDKEILKNAKRDIDSDNASFYFLYLSELDRTLHFHCKDGAKIDECFAEYAAGIKGVFDVARKHSPGATLTVFSDHGMTPVQHKYDLVKDIDALGLKMPQDYLAVYDSTMARFWFFSARARRQIAACLGESPCGRIVPDAELKELGVYFPDGRYGELIFLVHPGWLLSRSDFNGGGWMPIGMHGYHPDDPYSDAVFLSNREPSIPMQTIADMYQFMNVAAQELR